MKKPLVILLSLFLIFSTNLYIFANEIDEETDYIWLEEEIKKTSSNPTEEMDLASKYICVFDRKSKKILYGKNENEIVPMASTTKIMTAIVLMENMENTDLSLESSIDVCKQAAKTGGSRLGLKTGDKITINDLLYGLMLCSRE